MDLNSGLFSVSSNKQVRFAPGNLEYDSINKVYFFASRQYDYGGLFGWGTGGNPTLTSEDWHDYTVFDDWGSHIDGGWRTLSWEEWHYVIWDRSNATAKRGAATVCGVQGLVLLPDSRNGGTFHVGFKNGWNTNVYDASSWSHMEAAGAVFLPAAGDRWGTERDYVGACGYYWSSTPDRENYACGVGFDDDNVNGGGDGERIIGLSVRLVQDYKISNHCWAVPRDCPMAIV